MEQQQQETHPQPAPRTVRHLEEQEVTTEGQAKIRAGWLKARLELKLPPLMKSTQGHGYKYASLSSILSLIEEPLRAVGLFVRWTTWTPSSTTIGVRCNLVHAMGWSERAELIGEPEKVIGGRMSGMQMRGAFITYAQRYTLLSVLGTTADVDTDASNAVSQQDVAAGQQPPPAQGPQDYRSQSRGY